MKHGYNDRLMRFAWWEEFTDGRNRFIEVILRDGAMEKEEFKQLYAERYGCKLAYVRELGYSTIFKIIADDVEG